MEQQTVERASTRTTLQLGAVEADISLFKMTRNPASARKWAKPPVTEEEEKADPLAGNSAKKSSGSGSGSAKGKTDGTGGGDAPKEKPRKGIIDAEGKFIDLTDNIEEIAERTTLDRLEVVSFIRREQVDRARILDAYYVGANGGAKVLALLYKGLKLRERAAVVRWGKRTRSSVGVMVPHRSGALIVLELAYAENALLPSPACLTYQHVEVTDAQVEQIADLIDTMAEGRDSLDDIRNHRTQLEDELVLRAEHGELDDYEAESYDTDDAVESLSEMLAAAAA